MAKIKLSDHFTYGRLMRFIMPSMLMMIFTSVYSIVDGLFVSNFVGKTPFVALNLIYPVIGILGTIGFMIGTGGTAIVSVTLGEGKRELANEYFSMLIASTFIGGVICAVVGNIVIRQAAVLLGADGEMLEYCVQYGRILLTALPVFMLQFAFQSFFTTAEKPKLGLAMTVTAGMTNVVLDYLFVAVLELGLAGAAYATVISQAVGGITPLIYFSRKNGSVLRLTRFRFNGRVLLKTCTNGSSELMTNISASVVSMLYNYRLMEISGENGVAAYGVLMYAAFIFTAIFLGQAIGSAPLFGYNYGAKNNAELSGLYRKSLVLISVFGVALTLLANVCSPALAKIFVGYDKELFDLTNHAFKLYSVSFLICGFNIFGSAFFTALGNGAVSALISFLRTFVFQTAALFILPLLWDVDGIWLAVAAAEIMSLIVTAVCLKTNKKRYGYTFFIK